MTSSIEPNAWEISEDAVAEAGPRVRGLLVQRYEALFELTRTQIHLAEEHGRPVDPRWAELGVRVLKELGAVYRLNRTVVREDDSEVVPAPVEEIMAQIRALEDKAARDAG